MSVFLDFNSAAEIKLGINEDRFQRLFEDVEKNGLDQCYPEFSAAIRNILNLDVTEEVRKSLLIDFDNKIQEAVNNHSIMVDLDSLD